MVREKGGRVLRDLSSRAEALAIAMAALDHISLLDRWAIGVDTFYGVVKVDKLHLAINESTGSSLLKLTETIDAGLGCSVFVCHSNSTMASMLLLLLCAGILLFDSLHPSLSRLSEALDAFVVGTWGIG